MGEKEREENLGGEKEGGKVQECPHPDKDVNNAPLQEGARRTQPPHHRTNSMMVLLSYFNYS